MFTGIVEALGTVVAVADYGDAARIRVTAPGLTDGMGLGDSLSVSGVCLTVVSVTGDEVEADVMRQTLTHSTLGGLRPGDPVNLERAMRADGRYGGHHVQGHVDGTGTVLGRESTAHWDLVTVSVPAPLLRYVVPQGSLTIDGVSLTIADVGPDSVTVSLIPETLRRTTLGARNSGDAVNLEVDVLAKYVERLVTAHLQHLGEHA